jgi:hypothetical protein
MWRKAGFMAIFGSVFLALALAGYLQCVVSDAQSDESTSYGPLELTPGLIIQGHVWLRNEAGPGLPGVDIYRRYALYPGTVVATTEADGFYRSDFSYIPGDETVTVWANLDGYAFEPARYVWRHYHGYTVYTLDFIATAPYACYLPQVQRHGGNRTQDKEDPHAHRR